MAVRGVCGLVRVSVWEHRWTVIASNLPGRTGKQCRERWVNQLDPSIKRDQNWTEEEDRIIMEVLPRPPHPHQSYPAHASWCPRRQEVHGRRLV